MYPHTIVNALSGERITFAGVATDEDGEFLRFSEVVAPAGGPVVPEHRHLLGDERLEVVDGEMGLSIDGVEYVLDAGESMTVPAGTRHAWWNAGDTPLIGRGELRNPGRFEELITTVFTLANTGKTDSDGRPSLLQIAVTLAEYRGEYDPTFLGTPVKWLAYTVLAPLGRALGHEAVHAYVAPPHETGSDIRTEQAAPPSAA